MSQPNSQPDRSAVPPDAHIYSVSELNGEVRATLEDALPSIWIEGEISNLARPGSGHWYFSLRDHDSQVRCAMFRGANRSVRHEIDDGLQVVARARVTVYEPRGSYQLIVDHIEPAGEGVLRRRFEELKTRLAAEGLFDESRKKALPRLPAQIGVVTSPTGAAVRDILQVLSRRFASIPVVVYPVLVQGEKAQFEIVAALDKAASRNECDLLIVGRGGGSLEDLWAFNEERVARAIDACPIPIISAVGHEVDFTIADLVADLRAPTPSAAAEIAVPDAREWLAGIKKMHARLVAALSRQLGSKTERLVNLTGRLRRRNPVVQLELKGQRLDELTARLQTMVLRRLETEKVRIGYVASRLRQASPLLSIASEQQRVTNLQSRLAASISEATGLRGQQLGLLAARLQAVSPLSTLERGYAIIEDAKGNIVRSTKALNIDEEVTGRLNDGSFRARITELPGKKRSR